jgi:hypothetical protein
VLRSAAAGVLLLLTSSLPGVSTIVDVPSVIYTSTVTGVRSMKLGPEMATSKASASFQIFFETSKSSVLVLEICELNQNVKTFGFAQNFLD